MKRDTLGKISSDLIVKPLETTDPIEQMREQLSEYDKNIFECIERNHQIFHDDFYVVVITKRERLMSNVFRHYFFARHSCPTPDYDQAVYKYIRDDHAVELLWVIPDRQTCFLFKQNALQVHPEEKELLNFVLQYSDGALFHLAQQQNGEFKEKHA